MQVSIDTAVPRCEVMKVHILDLATELSRHSRHQGGTGRYFSGCRRVREMWQRNSCHKGMGCCWLVVQCPRASSLFVGAALALRQRNAMYGAHKWATCILIYSMLVCGREGG
jgi:hypothetical protein